ncbi:MAG: hypothetical protein ACI9XJ_001902 [Marivirga sp.]|jgi:hypothetical protein
MILFTLQLLIAHIIGDFLLQPDRWVEDKEAKKIRSKYLYVHILVHIAALSLLSPFAARSFWIILLIASSHYLIDLAKLYSKNMLNDRWLFFLDQLAHLLVIAGVVHYYYPLKIDLNGLSEASTLLLISALLLVTTVSASGMKVIMGQWTLDEDDNSDSLPKAGYYIGMLERLFVFTFIILNQWEAIGLLIAAKSVFRFGDLSKAKDRKLTEYILIGTLLSFGLAICIGLAYSYLLNYGLFP